MMSHPFSSSANAVIEANTHYETATLPSAAAAGGPPYSGGGGSPSAATATNALLSAQAAFDRLMLETTDFPNGQVRSRARREGGGGGCPRCQPVCDASPQMY